MFGDKKKLRNAAKAGDLPVIEKLLRRGVDPNDRDEYGDTPITLAAEANQLAVIRALLDHGGTINEPGNRGRTALIYAAENNHTEVLQELIRRGASLNIQTAEGATALLVAAAVGHFDSVKILLGAGADPTIRDKYGKIGRDYAVRSSRNDILEVWDLHGRIAATREAGAASLAENAFLYYVETYELATGGPITAVRRFMAQTLLNKRTPEEIVEFCRLTREALASSVDPNVVAKTFLTFENPDLPKEQSAGTPKGIET